MNINVDSISSNALKDISFIIPVYNTPIETLQRCIQSVLELRHQYNIEVIVVDDGSEEYIGDFFRKSYVGEIDYHYKLNGGVSSARNLGIDVAKGKYICFVDADDMIVSSAFNCVADLDGYQMIIFDIDVIENARKSTWSVLTCKPGKIGKKNIVTELVSSNKMNSPCSKLFLREPIQMNSVRFNEKMITGEDMNFIIDFLQCTSGFYYTGKSAYCYQREESSRIARIRKYPDVYYDNIYYLNNKLESLVKEYGLEDEYILSLNADHINSLYNYTSDLMVLKLFSETRKQRIEESVLKFQFKIEYVSRKVFIKYRLLCKKKWTVIRCLAYIRLLYLKFK